MSTTRILLRRLLPFALSVVLFLSLSTFAEACPTCKQGLAQNDPHHNNMVSGYFYSILFMMSMPFLLIGTFGGFAYRSVRRARAEEQQAKELEEKNRKAKPTNLPIAE